MDDRDGGRERERERERESWKSVLSSRLDDDDDDDTFTKMAFALNNQRRFVTY